MEGDIITNGTNGEFFFAQAIGQTHPVVAVIQGLLGLVAMVANVITTVPLVKTENLKFAMKVCLVNLTIMDAIYGLIFVYHSFALYLISENHTECIVRYNLVAGLTAVSLTTVFSMTLERLFAFYIPFKFDQVVTRTNLLIYWIFVYITCFATSFVGFYYGNKNVKICSWLDLASTTTYLIYSIAMVLLIITTSIGNICLFIATRKHIKAIACTIKGLTQNSVETKMNLKATITTAIVVTPFLISYLPFCVFCMYMCVHPSVRNRTETHYMLNATFSLNIINGILNPFIYSWRLPDLRTSFRRFFKMGGSRFNE